MDFAPRVAPIDGDSHSKSVSRRAFRAEPACVLPWPLSGFCLQPAVKPPVRPIPAPSPGGPSTTPNAAVVTVGGCQVFPADNAWNRDVSADPTDPASAALLAEMAPDDELHLDLGTTQEYYGIPFVVVPESQPLVPITYGTGGADYSDESDPGRCRSR